VSAELIVTLAGSAVASGFGWWMKRQAERLDRALEELAALKVQVGFLVSQSQRSESAR
jgi:hypothetical protein